MDSDGLLRYFDHVTDQTAFYDWIGIDPVTVEEGRVVGKVPWDESLSTPSPPSSGGVHGGVIATIIDMSAIGAVVSTMDDPRDMFVSTTELDVEFHSSVHDGLRAEAVVTESSEGTVPVSVEVESIDRGQHVATGRVVCRVSESGIDPERM